jgi:hypothetical protein
MKAEIATVLRDKIFSQYILTIYTGHWSRVVDAGCVWNSVGMRGAIIIRHRQ